MTSEDSAQPLVSILTPSFNQARWVGDAVRSVGVQTYSRIEHIIQDGGSTDGSMAVIDGLPFSVSSSSEPDRGQSHALNIAYSRAQGEIIGWLNSDDAYFTPSAVAVAVDALEKHPEAAFAYGHSAVVDESGAIMHFNWAPKPHAWILRFHNYIVQPTVFIRRSVLGDLFVDEGFDYTMDRELWLRLLSAHSALRVDQVLAIDRHQPERKSITLVDTLKHDTGVLHARYEIAAYGKSRLRRKIAKVTLRVAGIRLCLRYRKHRKDSVLFAGPSVPRLILQQALLPRRLISTWKGQPTHA